MASNKDLLVTYTAIKEGDKLNIDGVDGYLGQVNLNSPSKFVTAGSALEGIDDYTIKRVGNPRTAHTDSIAYTAQITEITYFEITGDSPYGSDVLYMGVGGDNAIQTSTVGFTFVIGKAQYSATTGFKYEYEKLKSSVKDKNGILYNPYTKEVFIFINRKYTGITRSYETATPYFFVSLGYTMEMTVQSVGFTYSTALDGSTGGTDFKLTATPQVVRLIKRINEPFIVSDNNTSSTFSIFSENALTLSPGDSIEVDGNTATISGVNSTTDLVHPFFDNPKRLGHMYNNNYHKDNMFQETTVTEITGWVAEPLFPRAGKHWASFVTKDRVYIAGGRLSVGVYSNEVWTAPIDSSGIIGTWTAAPSLPYTTVNPMPIVLETKVFLIGGWSSYTYNQYGITYNYAGICWAPINTDGTIGSWTTLNTNAYAGMLDQMVYNNHIYNQSGSREIDLSTATLGETVRTDEAVFKHTHSATGSFTYVHKDYYLSYDASSKNQSLGNSGHLEGTPLVTISPTITGNTVMTKNRLFALAMAKSYPIDDNGLLGEPISMPACPYERDGAAVVVTKSRIYRIGGFKAGDNIYTPDVCSAPFADGWEITKNGYELQHDRQVNRYDITITPVQQNPITTAKLPDVEATSIGAKRTAIEFDGSTIKHTYEPISKVGRVVQYELYSKDKIEIATPISILVKKESE